VRLGKARIAFNTLNNIKNISLKTKLKIFNSNVKSILLYGSETWRTTTNILNKLQTFTNHCLRRLRRVHSRPRVQGTPQNMFMSQKQPYYAPTTFGAPKIRYGSVGCSYVDSIKTNIILQIPLKTYMITFSHNAQ
jgi:hypothetical protein